MLISNGDIWARVANIGIYGDESDGDGNNICECDENGNNIFHFSSEPTESDNSGKTYMNCIYEGEEVYIGENSLSFPGLEYNQKYIISDIDRGRRTCKLKYPNGVYIRNIVNQPLPTRFCCLVIR